MNIVFAHPWWFLGLPLILLLPLLSGRKGLESSITFSSLSILASIGKTPRSSRKGYRFSFLICALVCAVFALARPQLKKTYTTVSNEGVDMVIAVDLSLSMTIDDFYPEDDYTKKPIRRLEAAKGVIHTFIDQRLHDRIGIVAFSGRPYYLSPITLDHNWLHQRLDDIQIGDIIEAGTAIGSAISASATRLNDRNAKSKVIVLITDGASNSGNIDPVDAAKLAAKLGMRVYTIAMGTEHGRVAQTIQRFPKQEFDIPTLKAIAATTNAEFFRARSMTDLRNTFNSINQLEKTVAESINTSIYKELFHWFAGLSFVFLILSLLYRSAFSVISPQ